jgi:hypothetical protein
MKQATQEIECPQSQSYHNHPKGQRNEGLSKAWEWILHCYHLEQPTDNDENSFRKHKDISSYNIFTYLILLSNHWNFMISQRCGQVEISIVQKLIKLWEEKAEEKEKKKKSNKIVPGEMVFSSISCAKTHAC